MAQKKYHSGAKKIAISTRLIKKGVLDGFTGEWTCTNGEMVKAINEALVEGKYKMTEGQAIKAMTLWCLRRQEWHRNKYGF